uniref:Uncharacterized protein n=1 Tax=Anguilla anguilla TaxID=7936 RepID=A0A0E9TP56_ANGAN
MHSFQDSRFIVMLPLNLSDLVVRLGEVSARRGAECTQ